jgi:ribosomal protein L31E
MQIRDRDLKKIKIDQYLNEQIWMQGIRSPVHKIKVKVIKQGDIVRVYAVNLPKKIEFKKIRLEKQDQKAKDAKEKKKGLMQKAKESMQAQPKEEKEEQDPEKKQEEKEKVKAVAEAGKQMEKEAAKQAKHQASAKTKEPKRPVRKVMNK